MLCVVCVCVCFFVVLWAPVWMRISKNCVRYVVHKRTRDYREQARVREVSLAAFYSVLARQASTRTGPLVAGPRPPRAGPRGPRNPTRPNVPLGTPQSPDHTDRHRVARRASAIPPRTMRVFVYSSPPVGSRNTDHCVRLSPYEHILGWQSTFSQFHLSLARRRCS